MRMPRAEYVRLVKQRTAVILPDCYRYRPTKRWRWLQDLAWSFLTRIGALETTSLDKETWVARDIDVSKLTHLVLTEINDLAAQWNVKPRRLILGDEDFHALMKEPSTRHYFRHQPREFAGLTIEVVPWMRGIIVLP